MIVLKNVSLLRGVKPVLDQASATLHPGDFWFGFDNL